MNWPPRTLFLVFSGIWCAAIFSFPWLVESGHIKTAFAIYLFFSHICHQNPARSFSLIGIPLPVCSRCAATYLGWLGGITIFPLWRQQPESIHILKCLTLLAAVSLTLDVGLDVVGVYHNTFFSRSLTGVLFGACSNLYLVYAIQGLLQEKKK
jgi:uncharacterized membrane protein